MVLAAMPRRSPRQYLLNSLSGREPGVVGTAILILALLLFVEVPWREMGRGVGSIGAQGRAIRFSVRYYIRDYLHALHDANGGNVL